MGRKDSNKPNKKEGLWSRKFDDEEENKEHDYYSRTERKKADKNVSPIMTSLLIFLALFIILPTAVYLWYSNSAEKENQSMGPDNNIIITQNESSRRKSESSALEAEAEKEEKEASERKEKESLAEVEKEKKEKQREAAEREEESRKKEESKQREKEQEESRQREKEQEESRQREKEQEKSKQREKEKESEKEQEEMDEDDANNTEQTGSTYTVKPGDNLYRIALNHGMTTDELKALNNISGNEISVGTVLKVK